MIPSTAPPCWQGCTMVNPYCPDDVCVRPAGHRGGHTLGTMAYDEQTRRKFPMLPDGASYDEVVATGWDRARDLER